MSCCKQTCNRPDVETIKDDVKEYYGKSVQKTSDFEICVRDAAPLPAVVRQALSEVHQEVTNKYYGCGLVIPEDLGGMDVLDLGSGAGQDCFVLSKLVGESGSVTGVDMTDELLHFADSYIEYHTKKFGFSKPNVKFVKGDIEKLDEAGFKDNSFDIVVSNCVFSLLPDKRRVLQEAHRILKESGELYFSDMYVDRILPPELKSHKILYGEGVSAALRWEDLTKFCEDFGYARPRLVSATPFEIEKEEYRNIVGEAKFLSAQYRLFKKPRKTINTPLQVSYLGGIAGFEKKLKFDIQWRFEVGEPVTVPAELASILQSTRFSRHFKFETPQATSAVEQDIATLNPFIVINNHINSTTHNIKERVKEYYGKTIQKSSDLETNVTCLSGKERMSKLVREALQQVHDDVTSKFYGCGLVIPEQLEGMAVLDLGSGAGQDCFVLFKLVGESGSVTGVDMTDEQLEVANKYIDYHTKKFGYSKPNVNFVKGDIEKLGEAGLKDNSFDIIVSNCVVNLVPDKRAVLQEAFRVLKDGGEMYFSDIYADRDLPQEVRNHEVLWGECVSGALWWKQLVELCKEIGFSTPRLITANTLELKKEEFYKVVRKKEVIWNCDSKFASAEYRLFKVKSESGKGWKVTYKGGIPGAEDKFQFDNQWIFKVGEPVTLSGEIGDILQSSRFQKYFAIQLDSSLGCAKQDTAVVNPFLLINDNPAAAPAGGGCCNTSLGNCCG